MSSSRRGINLLSIFHLSTQQRPREFAIFRCAGNVMSLDKYVQPRDGKNAHLHFEVIAIIGCRLTWDIVETRIMLKYVNIPVHISLAGESHLEINAKVTPTYQKYVHRIAINSVLFGKKSHI